MHSTDIYPLNPQNEMRFKAGWQSRWSIFLSNSTSYGSIISLFSCHEWHFGESYQGIKQQSVSSTYMACFPPEYKEMIIHHKTIGRIWKGRREKGQRSFLSRDNFGYSLVYWINRQVPGDRIVRTSKERNTLSLDRKMASSID